MEKTKDLKDSSKKQSSVWLVVAAFLSVAMVLVLMSPAEGAVTEEKVAVGPVSTEKIAAEKVTKPKKAPKAAKKPAANGNILEVDANGKYIFHASKEKVAAVLVERIRKLQEDLAYQTKKADDFVSKYFQCSARAASTKRIGR